MLYLLALLFWAIAVPFWLVRGWRATQPLLLGAVGWVVLVPAAVDGSRESCSGCGSATDPAVLAGRDPNEPMAFLRVAGLDAHLTAVAIDLIENGAIGPGTTVPRATGPHPSAVSPELGHPLLPASDLRGWMDVRVRLSRFVEYSHVQIRIGGSVIIPIEVRTEATTMSRIRNGM